jgi:hypothetical protein
MRFSRHARNKMRLYGVTQEEVAALLVPSGEGGEEERGNPLYKGEIRGMRICAVLALDDLTTVITVYDLET